MKLVLATKNPGKLRELRELSGSEENLELVLAPDDFDPEETGATFVENAIIKAQAAAKQTGLHALADDSGLEVDCLDGRPGIRSARYCEGTDDDRRHKVLAEVNASGNANRAAAFVCAMALCAPDGRVLHTTDAHWRGVICNEDRGTNGFGYDPIFLLPDRGKTSAEISADEKNQLSHRAQAWYSMLNFLRAHVRID